MYRITAILVLLGAMFTMVLSGCASHEVTIEADGPFGIHLRFTFTPIPTCGEGASPIGWTKHEGKWYQVYDTDGDGIGDCVVGPDGQAYAIKVLEGDPASLPIYPTKHYISGLINVDTRMIERAHEPGWYAGLIAQNGIDILEFDPSSTFIDIQIGFAPGTVLRAPGEYGLDAGTELVAVGGDAVQLYRFQGQAADVYWMLRDSLGFEDVTLQTEHGPFHFDGGVDEVAFSWHEATLAVERR